MHDLVDLAAVHLGRPEGRGEVVVAGHLRAAQDKLGGLAHDFAERDGGAQRIAAFGEGE